MKTAKRKPDAYDKAVAYLAKRPHLIEKAWARPFGTPTKVQQAHCLFRFADKSGKGLGDPRHQRHTMYGCPTLIRRSTSYVAQGKRLTDAIRQDERIPPSVEMIKPEHLPAFADIQRRLDRELKRKPPKWRDG